MLKVIVEVGKTVEGVSADCRCAIKQHEVIGFAWTSITLDRVMQNYHTTPRNYLSTPTGGLRRNSRYILYSMVAFVSIKVSNGYRIPVSYSED
ncbi:hypothetical protein TNCV_661731 [Trichonephila clavipes]|nr:hypothetical protein TNCV_661731 [Trichonephila clavipes]